MGAVRAIGEGGAGGGGGQARQVDVVLDGEGHARQRQMLGRRHARIDGAAMLRRVCCRTG
jgi:hypothetical protein